MELLPPELLPPLKKGTIASRGLLLPGNLPPGTFASRNISLPVLLPPGTFASREAKVLGRQ